MQRIEIGDILTYAAKKFSNALISAKHTLKIEKSGSQLAFLQGKIAGLENFREHSKAESFEFYNLPIENARGFVEVSLEGEKRLACDYLDFESVSAIKTLVKEFESGSDYKPLKKYVDNEILSKKNWLFFEANASRDIHWAHGFFSGIMQFFSALTLLHELASREDDYASENAPLFWGA